VLNQQKNQTPQPLRELVALSLIPQLGAHRIRKLLDTAGHPQEVFRMTRSELEAIGGIGPVIANQIVAFNDWKRVDLVLEKALKIDAQLITCEHSAYPQLLKEIYDPPVMLWLQGDPEVLATDGIAVVGTRRASRYGLKMAEQFTRGLVENGLTIVSGLALGVDAAAHNTTLEAGGRTIAVLGSGIDNIYPSNHLRLAKEIADTGGAVISEFPPGTKPDAGNFPVRNRVVSGLSLGTLVVESGIKGGSMITARSALDQNREVFVVPHALGNGNGEGCNTIIRRGWGKLVQSIEDILCEIPSNGSVTGKKQLASDVRWKDLELDEDARAICELLEGNSLHIDQISERLKKPSHQVSSKLLELELKNCVQQKAGKNFELR
jgi:DNA processing protein